MNWDNLKFFLAVCRCGTIRGAALELGVNHATVSRRIKRFEQSMGDLLFHRGRSGYVCTPLGEEVLQEVRQLEKNLQTFERKVIGKQDSLAGDIRVTLPSVLAEYVLMEDFADFSHRYPHVQLEILDSHKPFNLANREADVAFRLCERPPEYLVGRKLAEVHRSCYRAKQSNVIVDLSKNREHNWIGWTEKLKQPLDPIRLDYPNFGSRHKILNISLQIKACKSGMGVCLLPCFCGDLDPQLERVPPYSTSHRSDLWVLCHPDMRSNRKIQTFIRFMTERILAKKSLFEGGQFPLNLGPVNTN